MTEWLDSSVRRITYVSYESIVRRYLLPELGQIRLARLTPADVQGMTNRKLAQGPSARRVDYYAEQSEVGASTGLQSARLPRFVVAAMSPCMACQ